MAMRTEEEGDPPLPPSFPNEDEFEYLICYKCVSAFPWIKRYAGSPGFLPAVSYQPQADLKAASSSTSDRTTTTVTATPTQRPEPVEESRKRKSSSSDGDANEPNSEAPLKRHHSSSAAAEANEPAPATSPAQPCLYSTLPSPVTGPISLFLKEDFRTHLCRCPSCFPLLSPHPQLLDEEDTYEPPLSESDNGGADAGSVSGRSLLERGEAALSNIDRVRAIEGVMVYNHLKDKVKDFLKPFAESGRAVGAEDIKAYFEKLRGDAEGLKVAAGKPGNGGEEGEESGDKRREQGGY
jgi:E3 ubiquitin-protein ligase UBR7